MKEAERKQRYIDNLKKNKPDTIFWTEVEIELLINYWNEQGKSSGEIAIILGKTSMSIVSKINRLRKQGMELLHQTRWGVRERQPINKNKKDRKCLRCQEIFLSKHRFNKICRDCALVNAGVYEASIMRVLK